ncbi:Asp-tRNAAsn/Glu-tRNAGln amidotransferase A subunit-like amidase [Mycolicibacterium canariasense]|uniref:Asp-tRNAAsn/Glu-tRNAGln amidotransferase A subunit-like amidase n=1 Tax=Mycolicibacterium canariasense TaxID=228230 RepID=A0A100WAK1_MYCCR|nr:amidase [Mycolicibacterium canariasense]MCV7208603.1 amidase [Mycolicibacterium canariasense]ORV07306.1 glutamyl-tRNA amidotransferase [Mycolicibacterium canariasense]GAS94611.1 Asp-tRNAAsn/Glu-tRNAGln amidotransferase A subunit-like amidase [Mycolicibacterium canariasense]
MTETLTPQSIPDLRAGIDRGEIDPVTLVRGALARIAETEDRIQAFAAVFADEALAVAQSQHEAGVPAGTLTGIPLVVKDIYDVGGHRTGNGSPGTPERIADADAEAVRRLREAGAIILGKATTHEYAYGVNTPPTRNPWSTDRIPGGSSGGTAAAIAAGVVTAGLGTDTGGSIRIPAALCGVAGHKPTYGMVSRRGVSALSSTLDHTGPLGRSVADVVALLQVIAGHDPADPFSSTAPVGDLRAEFGRGLAGLTIGVAQTYFCDRLEPDVAAAFESAVRTLETAGAVIRSVEFPDAALSSDVVKVVCGVEAAAWHDAQTGTDQTRFGADVVEALAAGRAYRGVEYLAALRARDAVIAGMDVMFGQGIDLLVSPTIPMTAPPFGATELLFGGAPTPILWAVNALTVPANVTGMPALTVPADFGFDGLPIGLQFMGRPGADATVLGAGHAFEALAGIVDTPLPL